MPLGLARRILGSPLPSPGNVTVTSTGKGDPITYGTLIFLVGFLAAGSSLVVFLLVIRSCVRRSDASAEENTTQSKKVARIRGFPSPAAATTSGYGSESAASSSPSSHGLSPKPRKWFPAAPWPGQSSWSLEDDNSNLVAENRYSKLYRLAMPQARQVMVTLKQVDRSLLMHHASRLQLCATLAVVTDQAADVQRNLMWPEGFVLQGRRRSLVLIYRDLPGLANGSLRALLRPGCKCEMLAAATEGARSRRAVVDREKLKPNRIPTVAVQSYLKMMDARLAKCLLRLRGRLTAGGIVGAEHPSVRDHPVYVPVQPAFPSQTSVAIPEAPEPRRAPFDLQLNRVADHHSGAIDASDFQTKVLGAGGSSVALQVSAVTAEGLCPESRSLQAECVPAGEVAAHIHEQKATDTGAECLCWMVQARARKGKPEGDSETDSSPGSWLDKGMAPLAGDNPAREEDSGPYGVPEQKEHKSSDKSPGLGEHSHARCLGRSPIWKLVTRPHHVHRSLQKENPKQTQLVKHGLVSHDHDSVCSVLSWERRFQIALGLARGLAYLHHDCSPAIVHVDITSSNVYVCADETFEAMLGDAELTKLLDPTKSILPDGSLALVCASRGYIAPGEPKVLSKF